MVYPCAYENYRIQTLRLSAQTGAVRNRRVHARAAHKAIAQSLTTGKEITLKVAWQSQRRASRWMSSEAKAKVRLSDTIMPVSE